MSDPNKVKEIRKQAQETVLRMVEKVVTDRMGSRASLSDNEEKWLRAVYNPDRRMR